MNIYELPFGKIRKIDESIAEIIVDEGVEVNSEMVNSAIGCFHSNFSIPVAVLENKINSYTYTFRAQMKIVRVPELVGLAIVVYSDLSRKTSESMRELPRENDWNMQIFSDRKQAVEWLQTQLTRDHAMA